MNTYASLPRVVALLALLGLLSAGASCTRPDPDPARARQCRTTARTDDACRRCCHAAGMTGHIWSKPGTGCRCM